MHRVALKTAAILALISALVPDVRAADRSLRIAYMKHPIQEASIEILESWAIDRDVRIVRVPMAYEVFHQKITAVLTSGGDQFDIVWHNDDWGQIWKKWLAPTTHVAGMDQVDQRTVQVAFLNDAGEPTVVPMVHTLGLLMYRKDLVSEDELPETWDDLVAVSRRLQAADEVRWGFVGGMAMNHTWFTLLWSTWSNNCDVFSPPYERNVERLAEHGWTAMTAQTCQRQAVEFWWDAINVHKISPRAMTTYSRNDANAIFLAGDAAFTVADTTMYGQFNDPRRSRVAGKVGMAGFPRGPMATGPVAWNAIWGWAVPRSIPEERKALAMEALGASLLDVQGQIQLWHKTGGPPPNRHVWSLLADDDPVMAAIRRNALDLDQVVAGSYYMPQWPAVHRAYSDGIIEALTGNREDIPQVLKEAAVRVRAAVAR